MKLTRCLIILAAGIFSLLPTKAQSQILSDTLLIKSNDTQLYLELRGPKERTPILLYLHGGPGNAFGLLSFRSYVGPALESRLLVCYLHQRGVMNSPAVPDSSQTIANHLADVQNVVAYLHNRFPGRKVYLLGHSWGGTLAVLYILEKQGMVAGIIDIAGPLNIQANLSSSYQVTLKWAQDTGNLEAMKELKALGPPPYHDPAQQITLSKWTSSALGGIDQHLSEQKLLSRPPLTHMESCWQDTQLRIVTAMYSELSQLNIESKLVQAKTPLLMINGNRDTITPSVALRKSYSLYGGPKQWLEINGSHHLVFVDEPDTFVKAVIDFVH